ncbi:MAG: DNA polymerase III subunit alpha [Anaerolineae bacterium]|jgi:DNA polymerase-3 subunit alpha
MPEFVHLHVHTHYSLLDGLCAPKALTARAAELGMPALAITDHGALYGVVEFYQAALESGIQPIIGLEAYLAPRRLHDRNAAEDRKPAHLLLLAQNQTGYKNLLRLATIAMLEGYYYKPRIDKEALEQYGEGLIVFSGCKSSEIPRLILEGRLEEARAAVAWYRERFPGRFYLELQDHDLPDLHRVNRHLLEFAREFDLPLVATNDVHYLTREQAPVHDTLLAIGTGKSLKDPSRMRYEGDTYYMRTPEEMAALFAEVPEALTNTLRIAEMCQVELEFGRPHLPVFPVPEGHTPPSYLRQLCEKGLRRRYGDRADSAAIRQRLEHELAVIHQMGFDTYFLIVWDLCRAARERDIWYNARGSAGGSIVAYCLEITRVDPLTNHLIFERFLNPGRVTMPDIDLDFPDDRRSEMIEYALQKYGQENVAQIITFGTMGARAAVRDVGRVMDIPLSEVDRIAKLIPSIPGKPTSIAEALESVPELAELYRTTPYVRQLLDTAMQLEGVARHASTHAAGVVIADAPLVEYCPLHRPTKEQGSGGAGERGSGGAGEQNGEDHEEEAAGEAVLSAVTQWPMEDLEAIGLLKVDFLGLSTLTIMRRACDLIRQRHGVSLDLDSIPLDDPAIYRLLSSGDVMGVFQVEGAGFRRVLQEMRPTRYEHVVAALALYRPGPMEYIPTYIRRMHGEEKVEYRHPALAPILDETYGIIVYQEQIIRIATDLAGYEPGEADTIRKAVGKKKKDALLAHRTQFVEGCRARGIAREVAEGIFDDIEFFARYGFNKCLPGDVEIVDAATGRIVCVEEMVNSPNPVERVLTCDTGRLRLQVGQITGVTYNGVKPVFRLTTALGRQIEATGNHPFFTFDGWRRLDELQPGDRIAVPRRLPVEGNQEWPEHWVIALGHLLAEGNLCHPHSVYYYTQDQEQLNDYVRAAEKFENVRCRVTFHKGTWSVYAGRIRRDEPPGIVSWLKTLGLWGKNAREKEIPADVFAIKNEQIALLLGRLWSGDGHVSARAGYVHAYYATASERLARQVQHLLLRLGIVSRLGKVDFPYKEGRRGYQVHIMGHEHIRQFAAVIGPHLLNPAHRQACHLVESMELPTARGTGDTIPVDVKHIIRAEKAAVGITWHRLREGTGIAPREFLPSTAPTKKGFRRETIARLADYFDSDALRRYAESDLYWDRVVSIEYVGEKRTYDLSVAGTHNFIANDILVHNSHAATYGALTCQTAYLKAHYPLEYMTALLTVERHNTEKVGILVNECRRMGIEVLPPSINRSGLEFTIEGKAIRFGLGAVKNVGDGPVGAILAARGDRPFSSLADFCRRVDLRLVNRRALESLIRAGALDEFGPRARLLAAIDRMMDLSARTHLARDIGQLSLFGEATGVQMDDDNSMFVGLPPVPEVPLREMLEWEKDLLGVYLSEHPLTRAARELADVINAYAGQLHEEPHESVVTVAGMVRRIRRHRTKDGKEMAFVTLEDLYGACDVVVFPRVWAESREKWQPEALVVVCGKVDARREPPSLICQWVKRPEEVARPRPNGMTALRESPGEYRVGAWTEAEMPGIAQAGSQPFRLPRTVQITIRRSGDNERDFRLLSAVHELLTAYPGEDRFTFRLVGGANGDVVLEFPNHSTHYCDELGEKLADLLGPGAVQVT